MSDRSSDILTQFAEHFTDIEKQLNDEAPTPKLKAKTLLDCCKDLPLLLDYPINGILKDKQEKEVFLIGALGVISGILPNVKGAYDGMEYSPNLFCYILANYGSGKGALSYVKRLGSQIHRDKKESFKLELDQYEKDKKAFEDDRVDEKPSKPNQKLLYIPANNSKTGLFELIAGNDEKGIIFETEGDTLADNVKQDYGNYSDGFRKAFHHEPISYYRRTGSEFIEIEHPSLSVVLSSTYDQLLKLIPNIENGLFSRFLFYQFEGSKDFRNVFDKSKNSYTSKFELVSNQFKNVYDRLSSIDELTIELTEEQQGLFMDFFKESKKEISEYVSTDLDGSVNRLGLICFRVCMIFTTLRLFELKESNTFPEVAFCNDDDFNNAIEITKILKKNAVQIYYQLPKNQTIKTDTSESKIALKAKAIELQNKGMSYNEIRKELKLNNRQAAYRLIND